MTAVDDDVDLVPLLASTMNLLAFSSISMRSCLSSSERRTQEASDTTIMEAMKKEAILMPSGRSSMFATKV